MSAHESAVNIFACDVCQKTFTSKRGLLVHVAKVCSRKASVAVCCCGREFQTKDSHRKHAKKCLINQKDIAAQNTRLRARIAKLEERNRYYKQKYIELLTLSSFKEGEVTGIKEGLKHEKTRITNKPRINIKLQHLPITQIQPLTKDTIQKAITEEKGFNQAYFKKGISGITDFFGTIISCTRDDGIKEANYACTDISRNKFHRLVETREWRDDGCGSYIGKFLDALKTSYKEQYNVFVQSIVDLHKQIGLLEHETDNHPVSFCLPEGAYEMYKVTGSSKGKDQLEYFGMMDQLERKQNLYKARRDQQKNFLSILKGVEASTPMERQEVVDGIRSIIKEEYYSEAI